MQAKPWYRAGGKRVLDLSLVIASLPVSLPLLVLLAGAVRVVMGRPVVFRQHRPGRDGRTFVLYKFRTMTDRRGPDGRSLPDSQRLGGIGRFLRSTSLDELPELLNVLRGDMSLVGPRPLLTQYLERYTKEQARRHEVRPGLTGWAQVNGRNAVDWPARFALDVWYVDHHGLWLDLRIIARTVLQVVTRRGINRDGHDTCPEFIGATHS
jgi:lipopolysaccharide/colanic/teichoic acid biosynthesis glycosyltransferase